MNPTIWAKTDQSYEEHITNAYNAWKDTVSAKRNLIQRFCNKFGFSEERFLKSSLLTVVLHDIGKNITTFQQMIVAKQKGEHFDYRKNYRHELVSFLYAIKGNVELSKQEHGQLIGNIPLEAMAILGHHKKMNPTMESFDRESRSEKPSINKEGTKDALLLAKKIFMAEGYDFPAQILEFNAKDNPYEKANVFLSNYYPIMVGTEKIKQDAVRSTYLLLKAILHYADWHGSAD
jgi:CRISPR-associated endonuclease/helicase Cas3